MRKDLSFQVESSEPLTVDGYDFALAEITKRMRAGRLICGERTNKVDSQSIEFPLNTFRFEYRFAPIPDVTRTSSLRRNRP